MLIVTIKPLRLMNIVKTRSKAVTHNRFVRCLMSHFDFLQDETSNMNQATTILFMLANLYIQVVPTNNVVDSCLSLILGSQRWVPLIFVVCITVTVVLICLMLASLFFEQIYLANSSSSTLGKPKHLTSPWYRLYKHLYRFHFLVSEPILSGYAISFVYPHDPIEASFLPYHYCGVVSGLIGLLLSLPYLFFVESILPNSSITSASNRVNIGLTAMSLRLCLFVDAYYVGTTSLTTIFVLMMGRLLPSIIATYVNLFDTHFFNKYSRLVMVGFQVSNIVYSLIFYIMGNNSVTPTLVPACLFIAIGWRLVHNMDTRERTNLRNLSVNKLDDVLSFWSQLMDQANSITGTASMNALRFQAVMAHLTRSNQGQFEEYTDNFATTEEKSQDQACNPNFFMVYLFERNWRNSGEKDFKTLAYETLWAVYVRSNIFHLSVMLARLNTLDLNIVEKSTYRAVLRRVEEYTTEVYQEKMSLVPSKEQFYAPKTITEMNETAATKARFTAVDDDSKDGIDQTRTILPTLTRKSEMIHFDIYSSMITIEKYEKLVENMQEVISTILKFYEKLKNRVVEIASAHDTMKLVKRLKESVNKNFHYLDKMSGEQNLFHLLPYALFLEIINNDRQASQKVLKAYEFRSQQLERSLQMARSLTISNKFSLDLMLCIGVDCTRSSLGRMNYVSSNCVEVFRVPKKHFDSRNISCLMTDDFQPIHNDFMDKFVRDQDKPYLGISHERHVRIREHIYARCDVLVKLSPVLHSSMLSFMCLLKKHVSDEEFIVLNHQGVIVGRSQALEWADSIRMRDFSAIGAALPSETSRKIKLHLENNKAKLSLEEQNKISSLTFPTEKVTPSETENKFLKVYSTASIQVSEEMNPKLKPNDELKEADIQGSLFKIEPSKFVYCGRKVFFDLLLTFTPSRVKKLGKKSLKPASGSPQSPLSVAGAEDSVKPNQRLMVPVGPSQPSQNTTFSRSTHLSISEQTHLNSLKVHAADFAKSSVITYRQAKPVDTIRVQEQKDPPQLTGLFNHKMKDNVNAKNSTGLPKENAELHNLFQDAEGQSSRNSSTRTGTMYSNRMKAKVRETIKHQRRHMAWKEIIGLVVLQAMIWAICVFLSNMITKNFGTELGILINLRSGFQEMLKVTANGFNAGIGLLDEMLQVRGLVPLNKYTKILPPVIWNQNASTQLSISQLQEWGGLLAEHIYSFDFDYGKRFLEMTYNYTYYYGGPDATEETGWMTKEINLLDHARETLYTLNLWKKTLDQRGVDMSFDNLQVSQLYELMSDARTVVMSQTIARVMDTDNSNYQQVIDQVTTLVLIAFFLCLALAQIVVFLFWKLRSKTVKLYSLLEHLLQFELNLMQKNYSTVRNTLRDHLMSVSRLKPLVGEAIRAYNPAYQHERQQNSRLRAWIKTRLSFFSWLGYGRLLLLFYILIVFFQLVEYLTVQKLDSRLSTLLVYQAQQRSLMTTTNAMSAINFFAYFASIKAAGLGGTNLPTQEEILQDIVYFKNNFELIGQLDEFLLSVQKDTENTVNFMELLNGKPCDYMDFEGYGLTRADCESIADYSFGESCIEVFRWVRLQMPSILTNIQQLQSRPDPIGYLTSAEFLKFEFSRKTFVIDFVYEFTHTFFKQLKLYHQNMFVMPLNSILLSAFVACVILSAILLVYSAYSISQIVEADLEVFLLIPPESYYHNPHIAAKLLTITR